MKETIKFMFFPLIITGMIILATTACKKEKEDETPAPTNNPTTVSDIDGNVYHTVTVGTQVWMVENLRVTRYNDGTSIPKFTDGAVWSTLSSPGFCWYNNDSATNAPVYGAMYNWYAAGTANLCPVGWHVATEAEWATLSSYLGGDGISGDKLKESGTSHWNSPNNGATNESGFTALPGGNRSNTGTYGNMGIYGYWWTSTSLTSTLAASYFMNYSNHGVGLNYDTKRNGFSVRCVKD